MTSLLEARAGRNRQIAGAAWGLYIGLTMWSLLQTQLNTGDWHANGWADFTINQFASKQVVEQRAYPTNFVYPLGYVIVQDLLAKLPPHAAVAVWLALLEASVILCPLLILRSTNRLPATAVPIAALLGYFGARYFVNWDLCACNCNLLFTTLVCASMASLLRGRSWLSGGLLATSIALKLYSVVFLPYLVWRRQWRAAVATALGVAVWFVLLPAIYFGPQPAFALTADWLTAVRGTGSAETAHTFVAYLVSVQKTALVLFGPDGRWAQYPTSMVLRVIQAVQLLWVAGSVFLLWWFVRQGGKYAEWSSTAVLLAAVLPLSPLLQPHQGAVMLAASLLIAVEVCAPTADWKRRAVAGAFLAACVCWQEWGPGGELRGLGVFLQLIAFMAALAAFARPDEVSESSPSFRPASTEQPPRRNAA